MSNYDIELEINQHLKAIAVLNMIKQSNAKIPYIMSDNYYNVFGTEFERKADISNQRLVSERLVRYYKSLKQATT